MTYLCGGELGACRVDRRRREVSREGSMTLGRSKCIVEEKDVELAIFTAVSRDDGADEALGHIPLPLPQPTADSHGTGETG